MTPTIDVSSRVLNRMDELGIPYVLTSKDKSEYVQLPSGILVARERTLLGEDWNTCQQRLHEQGQRMLTLLEFAELLNFARGNDSELYNGITQGRNPWRSEWFDAKFNWNGENFSVEYHAFDGDGKIILKVEELDKKTLMQNKVQGISLEDWIQNPTPQGLPSKHVKKGDLSFWAPMKDNNLVAGFDAIDDRAILDCGRNPSGRDSSLGVRAVRHE